MQHHIPELLKRDENYARSLHTVMLSIESELPDFPMIKKKNPVPKQPACRQLWLQKRNCTLPNFILNITNKKGRKKNQKSPLLFSNLGRWFHPHLQFREILHRIMVCPFKYRISIVFSIVLYLYNKYQYNRFTILCSYCYMEKVVKF